MTERNVAVEGRALRTSRCIYFATNVNHGCWHGGPVDGVSSDVVRWGALDGDSARLSLSDLL